MRTAETILTVIHDRGTQGLPLERVYRLLFNKNLYLRAYARLYPNKGALTKGMTDETVDGMSEAKIDHLIEEIRHERFRWTPVRRVYIPKTHGKLRPLGLPTWRDKLVQEVIRSLLSAYYEPQFTDHSHGFRPKRGCHTALRTIQRTWKGTRWFIEGDIAHYFDTINHDVLITILSNHIRDGRFLRLIRELLAAGYMENWKFHKTLSGTPQGGVLSPLLSNIYLHKFDHWVETTLIPRYTRGMERQKHPEYDRITKQLSKMRTTGQREGVRALLLKRRTLPSKDMYDAHYRKLVYVRYADDFLLGYAGTKSEAEDIKQTIKEWLGDHLKIALSEDKTLITHARNEAARFLGYEIKSSYLNDKLDARKRRSVNGVINLRVPAQVVKTKCARYMKDGVTRHRPELLAESDYAIVTIYQQEYRGIVQYYLPAHNVSTLNRLKWVMMGSLLKTLAAKHKTSVMAMKRRLQTTVQTADGKPMKCLEVRVERTDKPPLIARFGGISLARQPRAVLNDQPFVDMGGRVELLQRLQATTCELCGSRVNVEVHHIRKLANLSKPGRKEKPQWVKRMIALQRKTLVVCRQCHVGIHTGQPTKRRVME